MRLLTLALIFLFQPSPRDKAVVFVCEHGAAKSVVATAYFNKLAAERGLPFRATFRGTNSTELTSLTLKSAIWLPERSMRTIFASALTSDPSTV